MSYTVSMTGELAAGASVDTATAAFAKLFKLDVERAGKVIGSGKPRQLAKSLDEDKARKLLARLNKVGITAIAEPPFADLPPLEVAAEQVPEPVPEPVVAAEPELAIAEEPALALTDEPALEPPPAASATREDEASDDVEVGEPYINQVPAMNGLTWIGAAFEMFKAQPFQWIVALIGFSFVSAAPGIFPVVGGYLMIVLYPLLFAGLMIGAHEQADTGSFSPFCFLAGFTHRPFSLIILGIVTAIISVITLFAVGILVALLGMGGGWLPVIVTAVILFPMILINLIAPSLVAIRKMDVLDAVKWSVIGGFRNVVPIIFNLVGYIIIVVIMSMTLMVLPTIGLVVIALGSLFLIQLFTGSIYLAFADIYD